jgi:dienelactone hydrolase
MSRFDFLVRLVVVIGVFSVVLSLSGCCVSGKDSLVEAKGHGGNSKAKLMHEDVIYQHEGEDCAGTFVWDSNQGSKDDRRPGVLIVHAWMGPGQHEREVAEMLASHGYVAFIGDIYGTSTRPTTRQEAGAAAGKFRSNRALQRARANAALARMKQHPRVDPANTAALGFCFGGGTVLELARSGADTRAVISFHGNLDTPTPGDIKGFGGHVLVLHGADDPGVSQDSVLAMHKEMRETGVSWEFIAYGDAVHSFSNPYAGDNKASGNAYNAKAAERAWERTLGLLWHSFIKQ